MSEVPSDVVSALIISAWMIGIVGTLWVCGKVAARIIRGGWKTWK